MCQSVLTSDQSKVEHGGTQFRHLSFWAKSSSGTSKWRNAPEPSSATVPCEAI